MNTPEPQKVGPPDPNEIKKVEGKSFVKRNAWLILILTAFIIIGIVSWLAYIRVKRVLKNYQSIEDADSVKHSSVKTSDTVFVVPYRNTIKFAQLNIKGGATNYVLNDTTNQLFHTETKQTLANYNLNHHMEDSVYVVDFKLRDEKHGFNFSHDDSDSTNKVEMKLNPNPVWSFNLDAGATDVNFDLSKYKVKSIKLNGGAGSFVIKLGQPLEATDINISSGAAEVKFAIPKDAACHIAKSSAFSSDDFEGFIKKGDNDYETPGFDAAKNKFYIHFSGAMSSFEVKRY